MTGIRSCCGRRRAGAFLCASTLLLGLGCLAHAEADPPAGPPAGSDTAQRVVVTAPEPLYASPTRFDRIGRIWVPVLINGKGPFRLVLDTGASQSAVNEAVALALGTALPAADTVLLSGATGSRVVSSIRVDRMVVGDVDLHDRRLAILADALGGADGVMGTEGLLDKRIRIDFGQDRISVRRSHQERAPSGFVVIPIAIERGLLVVDDATVGGIPVRVIIDTGAQGTIANEALRRTLRRRLRPEDVKTSEVTGVTSDVQNGDAMVIPEMVLGTTRISPMEVTVGDLYIFRHWRTTRTPTVLLGMDVLGLLDTLVIDYARRELQIRTR
jgi:predicted aspartyl protease